MKFLFFLIDKNFLLNLLNFESKFSFRGINVSVNSFIHNNCTFTEVLSYTLFFIYKCYEKKNKKMYRSTWEDTKIFKTPF